MSEKELLEKRRVQLAKSEGWISIIGNIVLFAFKYYVGYITNSLAIMADAWHTLSDTISSVALLLGIKISSKPPDEQHPFGHGRAELMTSLIIGLMLVMVSIDFGTDAVKGLMAHKSVEYTKSAIYVMIIGVVVKELMALYAFWCAKKTQMTSIRADAWHHRSDAISSLVILLAIIFGGSYWFIDSVLTLIVAVMLLFVAFDIIMKAVNPLLGEEPTSELTERVHAVCHEICHEVCPGQNCHLHHLHLHTYGQHRELTFHIRLPKEMTLHEAHDLTDQIEKKLLSEDDLCVTIHVEPQES